MSFMCLHNITTKINGQYNNIAYKYSLQYNVQHKLLYHVEKTSYIEAKTTKVHVNVKNQNIGILCILYM